LRVLVIGPAFRERAIERRSIGIVTEYMSLEQAMLKQHLFNRNGMLDLADCVGRATMPLFCISGPLARPAAKMTGRPAACYDGDWQARRLRVGYCER
jgi:hypothetical protein